MNRIEEAILANLIHNEDYCRKVIPHIKPDYFADMKEAAIASLIVDFFHKYNKPASPEVLAIEIGNAKGLTDKEVPEFQEFVKNLKVTDVNSEWLVENTEKFCKDRSVYNAIIRSIRITSGEEKGATPDAIPSILQDALSVCFDTNVGHDYIDNASARYDFYHRTEERLPFDIDILNKITNGGLPKKSLTSILAQSGAGKSLFMCHFAASTLLHGKNVLYITLEMSEERIAERIDANLLNVNIQDLKNLDRKTFDSKIQKIAQKTQGKLIVKEYPTTSAHVGHFRALLEDLKIKRDFKPDLICVDYLTICASQRVKNNAANSYTIAKSIAEELRGLAVEYDVPILTAVQVNRQGANSSDMSMEDTADSYGIPMTLDLYLALISTDELAEMGQVMIKQLKNRYNDLNYYNKFVVGIDRAKMKLYDLEPVAQQNISGTPKSEPDIPLFDKSKSRNQDGFNGFKF